MKSTGICSSRTIAADITGVSHQTVGRARNKSGGSNGPPEKRVGKDGKSYPTTGTTISGARTLPSSLGSLAMLTAMRLGPLVADE